MKILISFFCFICCATFAQGQDLLPLGEVKFDQLEFQSEREKELLAKKDNLSAKEALELCYIGYNEAEFFDKDIAKLDALLPKLKAIKSKKHEKQIAAIQALILDQILRANDENAVGMTSAIEDGTYHTYSGIVIYAYYLAELEIPYRIMMNMEGSFVEAYPSEEKIIFTTGTSTYTPMADSDEAVDHLLKTMVSHDMMDEKSYYGGDKNELFESLDLRLGNLRIADLCYKSFLNWSAQNSQKESLFFIYEQIKKSVYLRPTPFVISSFLTYSYSTVNEQTYDSIQAAYMLKDLHYYNPNQVTPEILYDEAIRMFQNQWEFENQAVFNERYAIISPYLTDKDRKRFASGLAFENGQVHRRLGNMDSLFHYFDIYYSLSERNLEDAENWVSAFAPILGPLEEEKGAQATYDLIDIYSEKYPELNDYVHFMLMRKRSLLLQVYTAAGNKNLRLANTLLDKYEAMEQEHPTVLPVEGEFVSRAYGTMATMYFAMNKRSESMAILDRGLAIHPKNLYLKEMRANQ